MRMKVGSRFLVVLCSWHLAAGQAFAQGSAAEPPPLEGGAPAGATPSGAEPGPAPASSSGPTEASAPPPVSANASSVSSVPAASNPPVAEPCAPGDEAEEGPGPGVEADHDAVFRAFAVYAASERDRRVVGAVAGVAAGATTMILGATLAEPTGTDPTVWYIVGGVTMGLSAFGLIWPSPAEVMARSFRVKESGHSASEARALEIRWNDSALAARRRRITGGAVSLVVSAVAIGGGIAISTGAGDFTDSDRYFWGTFLIATGATVGVTGLAGLFIKSPAERAYEAYRATQPETTALAPIFVAGPGVAFAGIQGSF